MQCPCSNTYSSVTGRKQAAKCSQDLAQLFVFWCCFFFFLLSTELALFNNRSGTVCSGSRQHSAQEPQGTLFAERRQHLLCHRAHGAKPQRPRSPGVETQTNVIHLQEQKARKINLWVYFLPLARLRKGSYHPKCNLSPETRALHRQSTCCLLGIFFVNE